MKDTNSVEARVDEKCWYAIQTIMGDPNGQGDDSVQYMGYSDWATTAIDADIKAMWYRFSRREDDYCIECSEDGVHFSQMRVCHMWNAAGEISFGIYACSPEDFSFKVTFTYMEMTECAWLAHDGQAPDAE